MVEVRESPKSLLLRWREPNRRLSQAIRSTWFFDLIIVANGVLWWLTGSVELLVAAIVWVAAWIWYVLASTRPQRKGWLFDGTRQRVTVIDWIWPGYPRRAIHRMVDMTARRSDRHPARIALALDTSFLELGADLGDELAHVIDKINSLRTDNSKRKRREARP